MIAEMEAILGDALDEVQMMDMSQANRGCPTPIFFAIVCKYPKQFLKLLNGVPNTKELIDKIEEINEDIIEFFKSDPESDPVDLVMEMETTWNGLASEYQVQIVQTLESSDAIWAFLSRVDAKAKGEKN